MNQSHASAMKQPPGIAIYHWSSLNEPPNRPTQRPDPAPTLPVFVQHGVLGRGKGQGLWRGADGAMPILRDWLVVSLAVPKLLVVVVDGQ